MCKFGLVAACLICAGQGLPQRALIKAKQSDASAAPFKLPQEARSLAGLLLAVNPVAAFVISDAAHLRTAAGHRRSPLPLAQDKDFLSEAAKGTGDWAQELVLGFRSTLLQDPTSISSKEFERRQRDVVPLDIADRTTPQLAPEELLMLGSAAAASVAAPYFFTSLQVVKVLTSSMGFVAAALGFVSEYVGKVSVAQGKEVGAITLQAAAEAEMTLARAERAKAIIPFTVGASCAVLAISVIAPALIEDLAHKGITHAPGLAIFVLCPVGTILLAAVAVLANQETKQLANRAVGIGTRRFASPQIVGRSWASATQQIERSVENTVKRWRNFVFAVLPAPLIGFFTPGEFATKAVVAAGIAAAQCAYALAESEFYLAKATNSVATKSRAAAVADTYANQGARAGSFLPFTSACCTLIAATTIAAVEFLPLVPSIAGQSLICFSGPALGCVVAAAAAVSKAQCGASANAATVAATTLSNSDDSLDLPDPRFQLAQIAVFTLRNARKQVRRLLPR